MNMLELNRMWKNMQKNVNLNTAQTWLSAKLSILRYSMATSFCHFINDKIWIPSLWWSLFKPLLEIFTILQQGAIMWDKISYFKNW